MRKQWLISFFCFGAFVLAVGLTTKGWAAANQAGMTFTVTSVADETDIIPGDGFCETISGACTLRAAVQEANAFPGADTITFSDLIVSPYTFTIAGVGEDAAVTGDLDITDDLNITGLGSAQTIIEAGTTMGTGIDRVFHIVEPVTVRFERLTIRFGTLPGGNGGGVLNENGGTVSFLDATIAHNTASHGAGLVNTGGDMSLTRSSLLENVAGNQGGAVFNTGFGTVQLTESTVDNNSATLSGGGGIFNEDGSLAVTSSTISRNGAATNGGGVLNGGDMTVLNSTISQNMAVGDGGGLFNVASPTGVVTFTSSTVAFNQAASGGGIYNDSGTVSYTNTIIARQTLGDDCLNAAGSLISLDYNLDSDNTCNLTEPKDIPNGSASLGPLQPNGGPTETHALMAASEAIDAGGGANCPATDQRGISRPQGPACDIGAYELAYLQYLPFIVAADEE